MPKQPAEKAERPRSDEDIARRRDQTVRNMIATPPKTLKGAPKRAGKKPPPK